MGSAKTALLLTTAYNFEERKIAYRCMKPVVDTRDNKNVIRSRIGIERECSWIYPDTNLYEMVLGMGADTDRPEWVLVDEAQFLSADQVDQLARVVDEFGINVICYGLRTDFRTHLFEGSKRLLEIADTIDEIKSTCTCGRKPSSTPASTPSAKLSPKAKSWRSAATNAISLCAATAGATSGSNRAANQASPSIKIPTT